jgi:phosphatidylserine/phosphatidylglycerophosphate/cardiolipin synthase-like enzyme
MRTVWIFLALLTALTYAGAEPRQIHTYTLPHESKKALNAMLHTIDTARHRIDAAIYSFTHRTIARHLAAAAKRGVKIRIVIDRSSNLRNPKSQLGHLAK